MCARNINIVLDKLKQKRSRGNNLNIRIKVNVETYFKHFRQTVVIKIMVQ